MRETPLDCAIIGDHFMLPEAFADALTARCGAAVAPRGMRLDWPDTPFIGTGEGDFAGLREFLGDPEEIVDFVGAAAVLITHLAPVTAAMLARLPKLALIAVCRGGPVNIDMQAARARGVAVVNTPGRNASAVAEFTIGAILAQTRLITEGHDGLRAGRWRGDLYRADRMGAELCEMTVGVVGYGQIGRRVVGLLKPFGPRILVADPYATLAEQDAADGVRLADLDTVIAAADVLTLHPRVTPETTNMLSASRIAAMKRGAYVVNTTRGAIIDYPAMVRALEHGHLRGAALDTFDIEPPPAGSVLTALANVTMTPHIAGASQRTITVSAEGIAEEVRRFLDGAAPLNAC